MLSASHSCGHRTLSGTANGTLPWGGEKPETLGANSRMIYTLDAQERNTRDCTELQTLVWLSPSVNSDFLGVCSFVKFRRFHLIFFPHNLEGNLVLSVGFCKCAAGCLVFQQSWKKKTWPRSGSDTGNSKGVEIYKTGSLGISLLLTPAKNTSSKWNNLYGRVETMSWWFYWETD